MSTHKNALLFQGGWAGHEPEAVATRTGTALRDHGYKVTVEDSLECLDDKEALMRFDLIVPGWTMGSLTGDRETALSAAVRAGTGLGGFHGGMGDAFRGAITYEWIVGGHFVGHPHVGPYTVRVTDPSHPAMQGVPASFEYDSEQYYLLVDPVNDVLATTLYDREGRTLEMPVVWTKSWGEGRVFYSALGHKLQEFDDHPKVWQMTVNGLLWATR